MSSASSGPDDGDRGWKREAVEDLADVAHEKVDKRKAETSSTAKSKVLERLHAVVDAAERKLKERL